MSEKLFVITQVRPGLNKFLKGDRVRALEKMVLEGEGFTTLRGLRAGLMREGVGDISMRDQANGVLEVNSGKFELRVVDPEQSFVAKIVCRTFVPTKPNGEKK